MMHKFLLPTQQSELSFTGERYIPGVAGVIELEHIHRYLFAARACEGKLVLDIASGEGFGSYLLSQVASDVVGVDISDEAVSSANAKYQAKNLQYKLGSCQKIPLTDASVDVVVSFETLEHIVEHEEFLTEIKRVLRSDGILIMSTPDTDVYSQGEPTLNHYHVKELTQQEYSRLIGKHFSSVRLFAQKCMAMSAIQKIEDGQSVNDAQQLNIYNAHESQHVVNEDLHPKNMPYLLTVSSNGQLPEQILSNNFYETHLPLEQLFSRVHEQAEKIDNLTKQCAVLASELEALVESRDDMLNSTSWKITQPLRKVKTMIKTSARSR